MASKYVIEQEAKYMRLHVALYRHFVSLNNKLNKLTNEFNIADYTTVGELTNKKLLSQLVKL